MSRLHSIATFILLLLCSQHSLAMVSSMTGYISVNNAKLYYERYGSGSPIVVIHGGPGLDQSYLKPQLLELAQDHEIIFYDQRGSGKSLETLLERSSINVKQFTDDIESVRKALGLGNITVLGHSWGGFLAMEYAIHYPEHLSQLILMNSAPADLNGLMATMQEIDSRTEAFKDEIEPLNHYEELEKLSGPQISALYRKLFSVYFYDPQKVESLTLDIAVKAALSGFRVQELLEEDMIVDLFPQLKKLQVPTLVLIGDHDVVPLWTSEAIANTIPGAKLVVIPKCGHFPYIESPDIWGQILKIENRLPTH